MRSTKTSPSRVRSITGRLTRRMLSDFTGGVPELHDLPLAPEARSAPQSLLPREHAGAAGEHGGSAPADPGADPLRGVSLPLPLSQPVQGKRRLPRHAALLDLPDPPARHLRRGGLHLSAFSGAPPAQPRTDRMGGFTVLVDGRAVGDLPGLD